MNPTVKSLRKAAKKKGTIEKGGGGGSTFEGKRNVNGHTEKNDEKCQT